MRAELRVLAEGRVLDVLPPEGFPTVQVKLELIPWCTTHGLSVADPGDETCELWEDGWDCAISTGGPDHEWWRIT